MATLKSAEEILEIFAEVVRSPQESLVRWKEENKKKIIGVFPMDIPEEIIHAAGMLPVVMWENDEPITLGGSHLSPYNCGIFRSVVDEGAKGKLGFLDGFVSYETCLQARHVQYILQKTGMKAHFQRIFLPGMATGTAGKLFMIENLERLKKSLEGFGNTKIGREQLRQSIRVYNENRALLRSLYRLRKENPGLLKAREIMAAVQSSMLMLKEDHSLLLARLLQVLEKEPQQPEKRSRIILSGSLCAAPRSFMLDLIEEAGMVIVDDDLYVGSRYFLNDAGTQRDPLEALTDRFQQREPPSPTKVDSEMHWGDYLVRMVRENQAAGLISLILKYCPPHLAYYPDVERKMALNGIHALMLEMEHEMVSSEQVKTRLQAFRETLEQS
jgi:benzoyl-CoA reductase subunit C